jgi:hypothetical protein
VRAGSTVFAKDARQRTNEDMTSGTRHGGSWVALSLLSRKTASQWCLFLSFDAQRGPRIVGRAGEGRCRC